jgi:phosphoglycolate phosphatase
VTSLKSNCIIFDFDGTIADTSPGIFNSIRYASNELNLRTLSIEELKHHLGPPIHEAYNKSFGISGLKLDEAIDLHKKYSLSTGYREFEFYPGVIEVLEELKNRGYIMGIATTKPDAIIKKICQENRLGKFFHTINGAIGQERRCEKMSRTFT